MNKNKEVPSTPDGSAPSTGAGYAIDLIQLTKDKIKEVGFEKARDYFRNPKTGKRLSLATIHSWHHGRSAIPGWAVQMAYNNAYVDGNVPSRMEEIPYDGEEICILLPVYRSVSARTNFGLLTLMKKYGDKLKVYSVEYTGLIHARNLLATTFVKETEAKYCLFIDDDMIFPIGSPSVYNTKWRADIGTEFASYDIVQRLTSHGKDIVSALCSQRIPGGRPIYQKSLSDSREAEYAKKSPRNELRDAGRYVGMGATLIHRRVFEEIEKKYPEIIPTRMGEPYNYFTPLPDHKLLGAEDSAFCFRAERSGFDMWVDLGCICGHEGVATYWPHK